MKDIELIIKYDSELEDLHIENNRYDSCSYMRVKTKKEIADSIIDFIESYEEVE